MVWIALDGYSLLRFCGALAMLLVLYYVLFDRKAQFAHCRYFLLSIVGVAVLAAMLRIPVLPAERVVVVVPGVQEVRVGVQEDKLVAEVPILPGQVDDTRAFGTVSESAGWDKVQGYIREINFFLLLYWGMVVVLALRWIFAVVGIMRLKRWGSSYCDNGITIVKNNRVSSPFSFFRMIFINRKLEGETLQVVLAHEKCHIAYKHYWDTLCMELFCVVFWCNPFVWLVRRELRELHEFEVDRSLLSGGVELSKYQNIIFDELMGYGPQIANGFHNSLIKKRFIMMKNTSTIRYRLLRKVMLVPAIAGVIALFAFTEGKTVVDRMKLPVMTDVPVVTDTGMMGVLPRASEVCVERPEMDKKGSQPEILVMPVKKLEIKTNSTLVTSNDGRPSDTRPPFKGRDGITFYPLSEEQVVVSLLPFSGRTIVRYIEVGKEDTRVTIVVPISYDSHWIQFDKGFSIVDRATGDAYMIRSITRGIEMGKTLCVEGHKGRMVEFTMVFPPLKKGVKWVDMYQKFSEQAPSPSNGSPWVWKDMNVESYAPPRDKDKYYDREGRPRLPRKVEYVDLRNDQVVESLERFTNRTQLTSIVTEGGETRLTVAVPIHYDRNWVNFGKGFCIENSRNGDVYRIKSMTRGIELNKTLVVVGKKDRMVEFTMVFPALKKNVKRVNIYDKYPEESALSPTNGGGAWEWRNVRVADYEKRKGQIIY